MSKEELKKIASELLDCGIIDNEDTWIEDGDAGFTLEAQSWAAMTVQQQRVMLHRLKRLKKVSYLLEDFIEQIPFPLTHSKMMNYADCVDTLIVVTQELLTSLEVVRGKFAREAASEGVW